jgi:thiamine-phosphate pyrophosphorylase
VKLPQPPLLVVTDRGQARSALEDVLAAAFAGGCRWASIREKDLPPAEQVALVAKLQPVAVAAGATLTLHGDPSLAKEAGLDGVHLSAGSDAAAARALLGHGCLLGVSVHTVEEAAALDPHVIDYVITGPAFATASKPDYGPVLGMAGIEEIVRATKIPVIAIGGIAAHGIDDMLTAGAAGVAVMGGVMRAADVRSEVAALVAALQNTS